MPQKVTNVIRIETETYMILVSLLLVESTAVLTATKLKMNEASSKALYVFLYTWVAGILSRADTIRIATTFITTAIAYKDGRNV